MTIRKSIAADQLRELDIHEGDVLRIVEVAGDNLLVELRREDEPAKPDSTRVAEWVRTAKGRINRAGNESADDLRMDYYAAKYQLKN